LKRGTQHLCSLDHDSVVVGSTSFDNRSTPISPPNTAVSLNTVVRNLQSTVRSLERRLAVVEDATGTNSMFMSTSSFVESPASSSRATLDIPETSIKSEGVADAALTFEYLALGKDRTKGIMQQYSNSHSPLPNTRNILTDTRREPLPMNIRAALLPRKSLEYVLTFAKDVVAWQHGCIHTPTFQRECEAFLSMEDTERWLWIDPLWLALFFVIQSIAVHQMPPSDVCNIFAGHDSASAADTLLQAAMSCLDAGHYLSEPSFYTCQALAILCVCGHNVTESYLLSSYLAIGIKTAQTLNLHALGNESARILAKVRNAGGSIQDDSSSWKRQIINLEMGKRVWWSFVQQEYFAIPFRGTSCVNPKHHDTPFPLNVHDEELDRGELRSEYKDTDLTLVNKLRVTATAAQIICFFFEALPESGPRVEEHVTPYEAQLLKLLPTSQSKSSNPSLKFGLALRRYINISISHKILVLRRAFCSRQPALHSQLLESQSRCVDVSRQILDQIKSITRSSSRPEGQVGAIWTISYQAVAAATVLALTFFQENEAKDANQVPISREEVLSSVDIIRDLASRSAIAERGVKMMNELIDGFTKVDRDGISTRRRSAATAAIMDEFDERGNQKRSRTDDEHIILDENHDTFDFAWDQYPGIASVLESMPDVSKLFDGSIGNPFGSGY
jgi:hypothetical protein